MSFKRNLNRPYNESTAIFQKRLLLAEQCQQAYEEFSVLRLADLVVFGMR